MAESRSFFWDARIDLTTMAMLCSPLTARMPQSPRKRCKVTLILLVLFGVVVFVSTFVVVLLNQDVTSSQEFEGQNLPSYHKEKHLPTTRPQKENHSTTTKLYRNESVSVLAGVKHSHGFEVQNLTSHHKEKHFTTTRPQEEKLSTTPKPHRNETISVPIGVEHYFWRGRQRKLVKLIQKVTKKHLHNASTNSSPQIVLNFTIRCKEIYDGLGLGTGNLVLGFYGMRLAAAVGGVDLLFRCIHNSNAAAARVKKQGSILSWLEGYYPAPANRSSFSPFDPPLPSWNDTARGMGHCPFQYMTEAIRFDLRRMAIQLVGPRRNTDLATLRDANSSVDNALYSDVELDDVAIHFRCGDVVKGFNSETYGVVHYDSYREHISPHATSIGIITPSFNESSLRRRDQGTTRICKVLVTGLVEYLQHAFPLSKISIRNGPEETLALAYARLVMANQTFCSPSTFSIFPSIASFGTSYIQRANSTYFVPPIAQRYDDVKLMDGGFLSAREVAIFYSWETNEYNRSFKMLEWLVQPYCNVTNGTTPDATLKLTCGGTSNETITTSLDKNATVTK